MTSSEAASTRVVIGVTVLLLLLLMIGGCSAAVTTTLEYAGCSEQKCTPGSQYSSNVNSLLTALVAASSSSASSNQSVGSAHGVFQCRPDCPDCAACVSACVSQLGTACPSSYSAALRLEGCYLRYDNVSFYGVEDKTLVLKKCGAQQLDEMAHRDSVLAYLEAGAQLFRRGAEGDVTGVAECVVGQSPAQCQDCLEVAIGVLKSACWYAASGDVFLASCYARYAVVVSQSTYNDNPTPKTDSSKSVLGTQKTLAVIIGIIAVIGVIVIVFVLLRKYAKSDDGCNHECNHK